MIPDDAPVPEDTGLYRRVHPKEMIWDENDGCVRPASGVFKDPEMSIHLGDVLEDEHREPVAVLDGKPDYCLISLTAGYVESEDQMVRRSPVEHDPTHGEVIGEKPRSRRRLFARAAKCVVFREAGLKPDVRAKIEAASEG